MLARLRAFFASRTGRLVLHDGGIALGTGFAAWDAAGHSVTWGAAVAAGIVAAKAFLRLILPVPAAPKVKPRGQAGYGAVELLLVVLIVLVILVVVGVLR